MFQIRIEQNFDKLEQAYLSLLPSYRRNAAYARGINKAAAQARTQWIRIVVAKAQLPYSYVLRATRLSHAHPSRPIAMLSVTGKYTTLFKYALASAGKPSLLPGGVIAGKWGMHRGAFLAGMKTGHIGIFTHKKNDKHKIRELWGPSIPRPLMNKSKTDLDDDASDVILAKVNQVLLPLTIHELEREMQKAKAQYGL